MRGVMLGVLSLLLLLSGTAEAQDRRSGTPRDSLEARVRTRMVQMLRTQLGLTDEQLRQLQATNQRFDGERRRLMLEERRARVDLRAAMSRRDSVDQARIGALLDATLRLQRERLDLLEREQRELATFLTPRQRAQLFGLEEQLRRRMQDGGGRDRRPGSGPPSRRPDGPTPPASRRPPGGH